MEASWVLCKTRVESRWARAGLEEGQGPTLQHLPGEQRIPWGEKHPPRSLSAGQMPPPPPNHYQGPVAGLSWSQIAPLWGGCLATHLPCRPAACSGQLPGARRPPILRCEPPCPLAADAKQGLATGTGDGASGLGPAQPFAACPLGDLVLPLAQRGLPAPEGTPFLGTWQRWGLTSAPCGLSPRGWGLAPLPQPLGGLSLSARTSWT